MADDIRSVRDKIIEAVEVPLRQIDPWATEVADAVLSLPVIAEALAAQERVTAALGVLDAVDPTKSATVMVSAVRRALTEEAP